ncbi:MAG: SDR family oxidoreductase [Waterburya sp.]
MSTNRRKFLGAIGATGLVGAIATEQANAQSKSETKAQSIALNPERELTGKVAIVTGARANIGRSSSEALAKHGADVVVHYHRKETRDQAEETARLVEAQGTRAALVDGDLGQVETVMRTFDTAFENFGQLDILVNNAGAILKKPIAEVTDQDLERMINVNSRGTFLCMREAARRISDNGRIINIGSSLLAGMAPNYSAYAGTKATMEEITRMGAKELGERGITVNTIAPGPIDTPFFRSQETAETTEFASSLAVAGRLGTVSDIIPLLEFLALPSSQWITGQTIWINGGYLTR